VPLSKEQAAQVKIFGANVKRLRKQKKLTQEKLAELSDLQPRTIQKIEAGQLNILFTTILRIRKALGCSWERLLGR
jgi:transcriptional regulator with XRE-family HTH domain